MMKNSRKKIKASISKQEMEILTQKVGNDGMDIEDLLRQITSNLTTIKRLAKCLETSLDVNQSKTQLMLAARWGSVDQVRQQMIERAQWGRKLHRNLHFHLLKPPVEKIQTSPVQEYHLDRNKVESSPHDIRYLLRGTGCCD